MELKKYIGRLNLTHRERAGIGVAIGAVLIFVLVHLAVFPFLEARHRMQRTVLSETARMQEIKKLQEEHRNISQRLREAEKRIQLRPTGFTLFSFLEDLAGQSGIKEKIAYMKPSAQPSKDSAYRVASVEMKLESMTSEDLVDYLYQVETRDPLITVKRLSVSKSSPEGRLQAVLQVETLET